MPSSRLWRTRCRRSRRTTSWAGSKLQVKFKPPKLSILRGDGKPILERDYSDWWPANKRFPDCTLPNRPFVSLIGLDIKRRVLVVWINYCGNDTCQEPPAHFHVYRLPKL